VIPAASAVMQLEMIGPYSDLDAVTGIHIAVNRFHIAGESSFFPKSPPGFIVANTRNPGAAVMNSDDIEIDPSANFIAKLHRSASSNVFSVFKNRTESLCDCIISHVNFIHK
jgi:hypothetical protein